MPTTFRDLQQQLSDARNQKAILDAAIAYLSAEFTPAGGTEPKKRIKNDDGTIVPTEAIDTEITRLNQLATSIGDHIAQILQTQLTSEVAPQQAPPAPQPVQAPPPPAAASSAPPPPPSATAGSAVPFQTVPPPPQRGRRKAREQ